MKILVLDKDITERTVIQQVVQQKGHEIVSAESSDEAMQLLQEGDIRFVIADSVTTDMEEKHFLRSVRNAKPPYYIYILVLHSRAPEAETASLSDGADDFVLKPLVPAELKSRVHIGERILGLGDHLAKARNTLERIAMFDTLTGTLNQKAFLRFSSGELERARRGQTPLSLIALDIDDFQSINEKYGENIGNDVLAIIARTIREKSRPYDGVGRYEEDMFMIILPGVIGQDAEKIAERIIKGIRSTNITLLDGREVTVGVSAGVASTMRITVSTEIEALIRRALEAVSQAKREGGNQSYMVFA